MSEFGGVLEGEEIFPLIDKVYLNDIKNEAFSIKI